MNGQFDCNIPPTKKAHDKHGLLTMLTVVDDVRTRIIANSINCLTSMS